MLRLHQHANGHSSQLIYHPQVALWNVVPPFFFRLLVFGACNVTFRINEFTNSTSYEPARTPCGSWLGWLVQQTTPPRVVVRCTSSHHPSERMPVEVGTYLLPDRDGGDCFSVVFFFVGQLKMHSVYKGF